MGRGWTRAVEIMEQAGVDDDAYMIGQDAQSGLKIAISEHLLNGCWTLWDQVIWVTSDEVASLLAACSRSSR